MHRNQQNHTGQLIRNRSRDWEKCVDFILVPIIIFLTNYIPDFASGPILGLDEGQHLGAVNELLRGGVPFREIYMMHGPLMEYIPYWLMQIFGVQLGVIRGFYLFGHILSLVTAFVLLRTVVSNPVLKYSMLYFMLRFPMDPLWNIIWGGIRWAPGFLALLFLYSWLRKKKNAHLFLAGVICGLGLLISQEIGIGVGASAVLCILLKSTENRTVESFLRNLMQNGLRFFLGFALAVSPFYCFPIAQNALLDYFRAQFIDTLFLLTREIPYSVSFTPIADILNPLTESSLMKNRSAAFYAISLAYVGIFIWTLVSYGKRPRHRMAFLLSVIAYAAIMLKSGTRGLTGPQFNVILPAFFITFGVFLETWLKNGGGSGESDTACPLQCHEGGRRKWKHLLVFTGIGAMVLLAGNPWTFFNRRITGLWQGKPVGIFEQLDSNIMPRAKDVRIPPLEALGVNGVVGFLRAHTYEQDPVFTFPFEAHINFLAERRSPTRFHTALYSRVRDEYMEEIIRDLEAEKPRYIVYNPKQIKILDVPNEERLEPIWKYIQTHYRPLTAFGMMKVLIRISDNENAVSSG